MKQADFFVLSSDYEGLPMTMLEAMSMGVVPISTPAGGVVDVVEDDVTGYLTDSFDDEEFYRRVRQAISEKGRIPRERIRKHYEQHFSMETCAAKYYEAYKTALTR
jgi:glycosyltransferase involved in cell wall biosynthesis